MLKFNIISPLRPCGHLSKGEEKKCRAANLPSFGGVSQSDGVGPDECRGWGLNPDYPAIDTVFQEKNVKFSIRHNILWIFEFLLLKCLFFEP